jgi:hypothetical protein
MMAREPFEEAAFAAVQHEIAAALPSLTDRKLSVGQLEIARGGEGDDYVSELRLYVFRDGQICDALEVPVLRAGKPAANVDDLREWFRSQLASLT